ncbi:MAG: GxxExxY protein [Variovorax paradoxus]|uniref:GxxExxY protein n=1 Tax=Variovorax paradoxus TaxID=34073 RepID=A0A2W5R6M3_VARPD|nr:MAG: GxxExxY protein [Variovorax paradoxus]
MNTGYGQPNAEGAEVPQRAQKDNQIVENDWSHEIIGAAVEVQRVLGTGLLESAYAAALAIELNERELAFQREVPIEAVFKGRSLGVAYRADFIVEGSVLLELKAMEATNELHRAQLLSYLRVSGLKLGLLINFHAFPVVKGIHRVVNKL